MVGRRVLSRHAFGGRRLSARRTTAGRPPNRCACALNWCFVSTSSSIDTPSPSCLSHTTQRTTPTLRSRHRLLDYWSARVDHRKTRSPEVSSVPRLLRHQHDSHFLFTATAASPSALATRPVVDFRPHDSTFPVEQSIFGDVCIPGHARASIHAHHSCAARAVRRDREKGTLRRSVRRL